MNEVSPEIYEILSKYTIEPKGDDEFTIKEFGAQFFPHLGKTPLRNIIKKMVEAGDLLEREGYTKGQGAPPKFYKFNIKDKSYG